MLIEQFFCESCDRATIRPLWMEKKPKYCEVCEMFNQSPEVRFEVEIPKNLPTLRSLGIEELTNEMCRTAGIKTL